MVPHGSKLSFACLCVIVVATSSIVSGSVTAAYFHGGTVAAGSIGTADSFPPSDGAYAIDDNGEIIPVEESELYDYDNESVDLVVPEGTDPIDGGNQQDISITAKSISATTNFSSKNAEVSLTATDGDINLGGTGTTINGGNGGVTIDASGDVNLTGARITTNTQPIDIDAGGALVLDNATVRANNGGHALKLRGGTVSSITSSIYNKHRDITITATHGAFDARSSTITIDGGNGVISLGSLGSMYLDTAEINSANSDPTADLGQNDATLHVDGTIINGGSGTLLYSPPGIDVDPASRNGTDVLSEES